jgi:TonB family protein
MRFLSIAAVLLASVSGLGAAQDKPKPDGKYDVQRCTPKVLSHARQRKTSRRFVRKGEKPTGYSPIVAFEILESGDVANALVKRSSGFANVDNYALVWVRGTKYSKRPGCGAIESQAAVSIDWQ